MIVIVVKIDNNKNDIRDITIYNMNLKDIYTIIEILNKIKNKYLS